MSNEKRYTVERRHLSQHLEHQRVGDVEIVVVHAGDFDTAQFELAALREDLESERTLRRNHAARIHELSDQTKDIQQRLTAAEQRNAELVGLLEEALGSVYVDAGKCDSTTVWKETVNLAARIEIAIKPTEPVAVTLCAACDGAGSVSTGIAEASSTICNKCDGTGTKP